MNQPICRAWNKTRGQWAKWGELEMGYDNTEDFNRFYPWWNDTRIEYEIMQFSGLKDKNGKDIYAGDILNSQSGNKFKVVFKLGCFMKQHIDAEYPTRYLHEVASSFWIVGNIYDGVTTQDLWKY